MSRTGWIYFVRPVGASGPVKIGFAADLSRRVAVLDASSPIPLELVASIPGPCSLEGRFHALFLHLHQRGEWFEAAPELIAAIDAINAKSFDLNSLPPPFFDVAKTLKGSRRVMRPYPSNRVGVSGVQPTKHGTWTAQIHVAGVRHHLGTFQTVDAAISARRKAEQDHGLVPA